MHSDRTIIAMRGVIEVLDDIGYNINLIRDTAEVESSSRWVKGRLQTAATAIARSQSALEDAIEGYREVIRCRRERL